MHRLIRNVPGVTNAAQSCHLWLAEAASCSRQIMLLMVMI